MSGPDPGLKPIEFPPHATRQMAERGTIREHVEESIRIGERIPARHGRFLYRLNRPFESEWDGRYYRVQQVAPIVVEEIDRFVVITVFTYYF